MEALIRIGVTHPDEILDVFDFSDPFPKIKVYRSGGSPTLAHFIVYDSDHVSQLCSLYSDPNKRYQQIKWVTVYLA